MRLIFQADGTFDIDLVYEEKFDFAAVFTDEVLDEMPDEWRDDLTEFIGRFSALERISVHGGTYQVTGDSLWVDNNDTVVEYIVDGESVDPIEFWISYVRFNARVIAALEAAFEGVSEEDYPAFEEAFVDSTLAEFTAQSEEEPTGPVLQLSGIYAIEDDTLFITATTTDEDGVETVETVEFHRIDVTSAVLQTSWGSLKAAWRQ